VLPKIKLFENHLYQQSFSIDLYHSGLSVKGFRQVLLGFITDNYETLNHIFYSQPRTYLLQKLIVLYYRLSLSYALIFLL